MTKPFDHGPVSLWSRHCTARQTITVNADDRRGALGDGSIGREPIGRPKATSALQKPFIRGRVRCVT